MRPPTLKGGVNYPPSAFVKVALGVLPSIATAAMIIDTMHGDEYETERKVTEERAWGNWAVMKNNHGHWSGYPALDEASDKLKAFLIYGPLNLFEKVSGIGIRIKCYVDNVLLPNAVPIAISIAALYMGLGHKRIHAPFKATGRWLREVHVPVAFQNAFKQFFAKVGEGLGKGLGHMVAWPFKSLHHAGFAAAFLGILAFFANRFHDVYTDSAEEQFFRPQILGLEEEGGKEHLE
jgi:hypothetical protein